MKKIIVTGGLGFIGSNLVKLLIKKKFKVLNLDKISYASNFYNLKDIADNKNYTFLKNDLSNEKKLKKIINEFNPDCIFNLAAETHVDRSIENPRDFVFSNIISTFNLLNSLDDHLRKKPKFKFIHISTDEVYGDKVKGRSKENDPLLPSSPYAATKASSDMLIYSYFKTFNFPVIVTNCSNNYGPNQHPEKLIPKLIYNLIHKKDLPIYGNGKNSREWIYVKDHCEALLKIYNKGKIGEFYNIGSNLNFNNLQIAKTLMKIANLKIKKNIKIKIKFIKDRPAHDLRYAINSQKIRKKLKWKDKTKLYRGLEETFDWYLNNQKYYLSINKEDIIKRKGLI
tara:strand:- start:693 stop:1712 length:1020 start_codon:yes stop_codon:yes gene_type:complete